MSLAAKLSKALPGATVRQRRAVPDADGVPQSPPPMETWEVVRDGRVLATGPSEREAVSRAEFLWVTR